jgi:hypothetical protein
VLADALVTITGSGTGAAVTATVDPKTGGVTGYTVTGPGTGYTTAPMVAVTSPGVAAATGAAGTAVISTGVVTTITVAEAGFGFTTPSVAITGGGVPSTPATAQPSGGVDSLTLAAGGAGYLIQPIVHFSAPDAASYTPPGHRPGNCQPVRDGDRDRDHDRWHRGRGDRGDPGLGVQDRPHGGHLRRARGERDAGHRRATIGVGRVDIVNGGAGYDSVPAVTITESVGGADKGSTATAANAALGAVTAIAVTTAGSGYLTSGLKKFVDTLAGLGPTAKNNLGNYIPVAVPDTTTYPGAEDYEIGVVQYRQKFASSLPATLRRRCAAFSGRLLGLGCGGFFSQCEGWCRGCAGFGCAGVTS